MTCNSTSNTTRGIGFSGGNPVTVFRNNTMQAHRYGFFLDQNGVIGQQGTATAPADNQWAGTWLAGNYKTAVLNGATAQNSKMYVRNASNYNPDGSSQYINSNPNDVYSSAIMPQTLYPIPIAPPLFDVTCLQIISLPFFQKNMELIAGDDVDYSDWGVSGEQMRYINKYTIYNALRLDSINIDSSEVLRDFVNSSLFSSRGRLYHIAKRLSEVDIFNAALSTMSFSPDNNIEENYKKYFWINISHLQNFITPADSSVLREIAEKCPYTDGAVVYHARSLFNLIYNARKVFEDMCPEPVEARSAEISVEQQSNIPILYPNPAKNEVFISFPDKEQGSVELKVTDANGKTIYNNLTLEVYGGLAIFTLDVDNGMYFVHVIHKTNNKTSIEKLIIQK